jgi:hypothetical protein
MIDDNGKKSEAQNLKTMTPARWLSVKVSCRIVSKTWKFTSLFLPTDYN